MKQKIIVFILCFVFLASMIPTCQSNFSITNIKNDEVNHPIWDIDDQWTYQVSISISTSEGDVDTSIDIDVGSLIVLVESENNENYQLSFNGEVSGNFFIKIGFARINGQLIDTSLDGHIILNKTTFQIQNVSFHLDGQVKVSLLRTDLDLDLDISYVPSMEIIQFPLTPGLEWYTDDINVIYNGVLNIPDINPIVNLLFPDNDEEIPEQIPIYINSLMPGSYYTCSSIEEINIGSMGSYSCYVIDTVNKSFYYSPILGTIVTYIPQTSNQNIQFDFRLKSTSYTIPGSPSIPTTPQGTTTIESNVNYEYSTSSTDFEGNEIYYYFDWDDGTNSGWLGPYPSGIQINASHSWDERGSYSIRVKARDTNGFETKWSDPLWVSLPKIRSYPLLEWLFEKILQLFPFLTPFLNFF